MPGRERKSIPGHGSNISKGSLLQGPVHHYNTEFLKLSEESEEESRDEATQICIWRNCTRDNAEAGETCFVLNLTADW